MTYSPEAIFSKLTDILCEQLGLDTHDIQLHSAFVDLGMDSLDGVELVMAIEEEFDIATVDDLVAEKWTKVSDVVDYLVSVKKDDDQDSQPCVPT